MNSLGPKSFALKNTTVSLEVTEVGGHLAPVEFQLPGRSVRPFSIAPWWDEPRTEGPPIIQVLRGDFFCLPFGANSEPIDGVFYPLHGEPANNFWTLKEESESRLALSLAMENPPGRVEKIVELRAGQTAVYQTHRLTGLEGRFSVGHHAMLKFESPGLVSTSPFSHGQVAPGVFEDPAKGGYSSLKPGAEFESLESVPRLDGGVADLSRYPAREGFEDLAMVCNRPEGNFAWTAVVFPEENYLWIAFKNPQILASTLFWFSNGGRHYAPWSGRHRRVLGLEEVTAYFAEGQAASVADNPLSDAGIPTTLEFQSSRAREVRYIFAVAAVEVDFDHVREVRFEGGEVEIVSRSKRRTRLTVDLDFLSVT